MIVSRKGTPKIRKTKPDLSRNEVAIKLNLNLPDSLFTQPILQANVEIDKSQVATYPLDTEVAQSIKDAVLQSTGMDLSIQILDPNEGKE